MFNLFSQLGVRDAFYRYRADFSKMSPDELLYVRSIEQVVTISVTQYPEAGKLKKKKKKSKCQNRILSCTYNLKKAFSFIHV